MDAVFAASSFVEDEAEIPSDDFLLVRGRYGGGRMSETKGPDSEPFYCPKCDREVDDPLVCGDCSAVICRQCGTPLEKANELGIG